MEKGSLRAEELHASILCGETICGFGIEAARKGKIVYVNYPAKHPQEAVYEGLQRFIDTGKDAVLALIAPTDFTHHAQVEENAWQIFKELLIAGNRIALPNLPSKKIRPEIEQLIQRIKKSDYPMHHHVPTSRNPEDVLFTIAISPHYPKQAGDISHPRSGKHFSLIVTRKKDVDEAKRQHPAVLQAIREKMKRAFGGIEYDADALVLPMYPAHK